MNLDLSKLQFVLFDWDNTLAETRSTLVAVVNQVLAEYKLPPLEQCTIYQKDLSFRDNFPNIFGSHLAKEAYERYARLYKQKVADMISALPGASETIAFFQHRNIPMVVMSNKDRNLLDFELPLLFNPHPFTKIVAGHEAPHDKPYPDQAWYALAQWLPKEAFSPEKVWVIGDSPMDSDCALSAGANPIRIGKPIWDNTEALDERILYFSDFQAFLNCLKSTV